MAKKFNLGDYLKDENVSRLDTEQIVYIDLDRIDPDPANFYSLDGLDELAGNIELIGLQQPLRVRPEGERFVIVSGHRRRAACMLIRDGGSDQFARGVPCIVDYGEASPAMRELRLIYANASTRVLTSAELSKQAERVTELLYELKEQGVEFPGRMREHVAAACRVSASKLARLAAIRKNLDPALLDLYDKGTLINETSAYELQKLPKEVQAYLGTQKKIQNNGIAGDRASELVKRAETYLHPKCTCPDGSACSHTLARFKQAATADMSWRQCHGGCCLNCRSSLNDCPYQCPQSKKKLEAEKVEKQEQKERDAEKEERKRDRERLRLSKEYGAILKLAEAKGLPDTTRLYFSDAYSVADLRERAAGEGFSPWKLTERNTPVSGLYASDIAKSADALGVTVDFLLGREPQASQAPEPVWQTGTPPRRGRYFCKVDMGTTRPHEQRGSWDGNEWTFYGVKLQDDWTVVGWWPLPKEE